MIEPKEQFADVSVQRLAKVYAKALLDSAEREGKAQEILQNIDSLIDDVFKVDPRVEMLFSSAVMGRNAREDALKKVFGSGESQLFLSFLFVLNRQDRLELLRPIRKAVHDLYDQRARRIHVHVQSAIPLAEEFQERIRQAVQERFHLEPVLMMTVDPALLGGLKIRIGDRQYDATVRTRIDNLRNQLITSSSHEIQSQRNRFCPDLGN